MYARRCLLARPEARRTDKLTLTTRDLVARNDSTAPRDASNASTPCDEAELRAPNDEDEEVEVGDASEMWCLTPVFRRIGSRCMGRGEKVSITVGSSASSWSRL